MKNKFYIMTALVISLTGCSNIEDGTQPTGNFPEDHIIRVVTEVKAPVSRAGYDASNLESFGLIIHNSENIAYDYNSQMVKSNNMKIEINQTTLIDQVEDSLLTYFKKND